MHSALFATIDRIQLVVSMSSTPIFCLTRKLHAIKHDLKAWKVVQFANLHMQVEKNENLQIVKSKLNDNPHNPRLND